MSNETRPATNEHKLLKYLNEDQDDDKKDQDDNEDGEWMNILTYFTFFIYFVFVSLWFCEYLIRRVVLILLWFYILFAFLFIIFNIYSIIS